MLQVDPSDHGSWQIMVDNLILMPGYVFMPALMILGAATYWGLIIASAMTYAAALFVILKLISMLRYPGGGWN